MSASMYSTNVSAIFSCCVQYMTAAGLLYEPDDSWLCGLLNMFGWTNVGPMAMPRSGYLRRCSSEHASSRVILPGMPETRWL